MRLLLLSMKAPYPSNSQTESCLLQGSNLDYVSKYNSKGGFLVVYSMINVVLLSICTLTWKATVLPGATIILPAVLHVSCHWFSLASTGRSETQNHYSPREVSLISQWDVATFKLLWNLISRAEAMFSRHIVRYRGNGTIPKSYIVLKRLTA